MAERFLKFIPSEEAFWLMKNKPNAFFLLTHIANTARRTSGCPDGLEIGQCHLRHWREYKFTEQEYRTAKKILVDRKHIQIIETNRTRQKSTTGSTTKSTLVKIISSTVYEINAEIINDRINDRTTTEQRLNNDKQESIRKKKKEKEEIPPTPSLPKISKIKFREFVTMTQEQHDSLMAKHGAEMLNLMLDKLDSFKGSSGKKYDSDFHTMKDGGWVVNQVKKDLQGQRTQNEKNFRHAPGATLVANIQPIEPKFQPGRILRGDNEGSVGSGGGHD